MGYGKGLERGIGRKWSRKVMREGVRVREWTFFYYEVPGLEPRIDGRPGFPYKEPLTCGTEELLSLKFGLKTQFEVSGYMFVCDGLVNSGKSDLL